MAELRRSDADAATLLEAAASRFSRRPREILMNLLSSIEGTLGFDPSTLRASDQTCLAILADNSYSTNEWTENEDGEEERLFEAEIEAINGAWLAFGQSALKARIQMLIQLLNQNTRYTRKVTGESPVFHWVPILRKDPPMLVPDGFVSGDGTPLCQRFAELLAMGLVKDQELSAPPFNKRATFKYLCISDGLPVRDPMPIDDLACLLGELPENHQPYFLGLGEEEEFRPFAEQAGFANISVCPKDGRELRNFVQLWSQSAADTSSRDSDTSASAKAETAPQETLQPIFSGSPAQTSEGSSDEEASADETTAPAQAQQEVDEASEPEQGEPQEEQSQSATESPFSRFKLGDSKEGKPES